MDKGMLVIGGIALLVPGIIIAIAMASPDPKMKESFEGADNETISEEGVHWHPELAIFIRGEKQVIPTDIGLGGAGPMGMEPLHTHDTSGQIHAEWQFGPIKQGDMKLARFFEQWGKTFTKEQILDSKTSEGGTITMLVNGQPNVEYENYVMHDGDTIEIRYE